MKIIYEDNEIIICHKMPGVPVQTARTGQQDMVSMLRNYFADKGESTEIFLIRRLDQPVEGIMVFARSSKAAAILSRQVQEKSVEKQYLALAEGQFKEKTGELEDYLLKDGKNNTSQVVPKGTKGAKPARLFYEVKKVFSKSEQSAGILAAACQSETVSLVKIRLDTGRHHQIRVQMAHAGHPLVGDKKYNINCPSGYLPVGLCSVQTSFCHPRTGERMEFTVEPMGRLFTELL
ncbi:RluA family pseudouridine synthase [Petralouisia muris]|uniref:RluA family pseudouridine synthase n=1 Tax=Petralouisia muris TaxID=3032872 RepID=A0AC61RUI1_9FIRM|nr:RluA family pseudouridine synthase [Petralouisia muris]TGY95511.1 RluA family pseudouridine synthase [Petralouisia muris]